MTNFPHAENQLDDSVRSDSSGGTAIGGKSDGESADTKTQTVEDEELTSDTDDQKPESNEAERDISADTSQSPDEQPQPAPAQESGAPNGKSRGNSSIGRYFVIIGIVVAIALVAIFTFEERQSSSTSLAEQQAAEQGNALEQCLMGVKYLLGDDVPLDEKEAVKCFRKAAEQDYKQAQYCLGICYLEGKGVDKDLDEAVKWFKPAAEQGSVIAQYQLGLCYQQGLGVVHDDKEAVKWFLKAANQDLTGETADYFAEMDDLARIEAQLKMGDAYMQGDVVEQDIAKAAEWLRKAAEQGDARAEFSLGKLYESGVGVPLDLTEAVKWYSKAADQDFDKAIQALKGLQASTNISKVPDVVSEGAEQEHEDAKQAPEKQQNRKKPEALQGMRMIAEQGNMHAQYMLGVFYETDEVVDRDLDEAAKWYGKAAAQGNEPAKQALKRIQDLKAQQAPVKQQDHTTP